LGRKADTFVTRIHVARGPPTIVYSGKRRTARMRMKQLRIHIHE